MKSTIFREVLNEEFIEVNKSVPETIQYLREQSRVSHVLQPDDMRIYFECSKKGKISVKSNFGVDHDLYMGLDIYYLGGNVISKDNKTYVKINSIYKKSDIWLRSFILVLSIFLSPICFSLYLDGIFSVPAILAAFVVFLITFIYCIYTTSIRKSRGLEIINIMENEIKRRVENIEHWDD